MTLKLKDQAEVKGVRRTNDGFLVAEAFVAREGIQLYRGAEVGDNKRSVVRVLRPRDEVMKPESVRTYTHAPVTRGHPNEFVTADNWKDLASGEVSTEAEWVDGKLKLPLIIKDKEAIEDIESGVRELSAGYICALEWADGVDPKFGPYDAIQRDIRINHVAIVKEGRAGKECRIGDGADVWGASPITTSDHKEAPMGENLKLVVLGDTAVNVPLADAQTIEKFKTDMHKRLDDAAASHQSIVSAKDTEIGELKVQLQQAKDSAITPDKMTKLIADRVALESTVKALDGSIKTEGVSDSDLRKAVVEKKMGTESVKDASDDMIRGMFTALSKGVKADPVLRAVGDDRSGGAGRVQDADALKSAAEKARQEQNQRSLGAWKGDRQRQN